MTILIHIGQRHNSSSSYFTSCGKIDSASKLSECKQESECKFPTSSGAEAVVTFLGTGAGVKKSYSDHLWSSSSLVVGYPEEVAGVTFSDTNSAPVQKFWGPAFFQIWESDSCSDSGYNHQSNLNLPMFFLKKWPHRLLLLPKWKSYSGSGSGFPQIFDSWSGSWVCSWWSKIGIFQ